MIYPFLCSEQPVFTSKPPPQVEAVVGSTLSLCCAARGSPLLKVQWSRAGQASDSTLAFQENRCLKFDTVKFDSDGDYICRATNNYGLAETTTTVTTLGSFFYTFVSLAKYRVKYKGFLGECFKM